MDIILARIQTGICYTAIGTKDSLLVSRKQFKDDLAMNYNRMKWVWGNSGQASLFLPPMNGIMIQSLHGQNKWEYGW